VRAGGALAGVIGCYLRKDFLLVVELLKESGLKMEGSIGLNFLLRVVVAQDPRKSSRAPLIANDNAIALAA